MCIAIDDKNKTTPLQKQTMKLDNIHIIIKRITIIPISPTPFSVKSSVFCLFARYRFFFCVCGDFYPLRQMNIVAHKIVERRIIALLFTRWLWLWWEVERI